MLDAAVDNGLPQALEEPLRFLYTGDLTREDQRRVERVEGLRSELAASNAQVSDGPGGQQTSVRRLAVFVSADRRFGTFLYLCAKATQAQTILELGSCVGIGMSYMASAGCQRIVSAEGEPERAEIARRTVQRLKPDAEVVVGFFDDVLDDMLAGLTSGIDMAWIDGHHQREPTLRYLDVIKPALNPGAILVFDDIDWSDEMGDTWRTLQRTDGFVTTIDLKQVGVGVWHGGKTTPQVLDLRGIYGRPRLRRRPSMRSPVAA